MKSTGAYQVRCKCGTFRAPERNDFVIAAMYGGYAIGSFTGADGHTYYRNADFRCETCKRYYTVREIYGTVKPDHKCDARCRASKGFQCECSCGGKNHGSGN